MSVTRTEAASRPRERRAQALRILVADDERDTADTLCALLKDEGHVVHCVYSGKAVVPAAAVFLPDALICDIAIPGVSGYAIAQAIRNTYLDRRRPLLIAISGFWREPPDRLVAQQVGFDHHFVKPVDTAELIQLLSSMRTA